MSVDYKYLQELPELAPRRDKPGAEKPLVERLLEELETHERSERDLLEDYRAAAKALPDSGVRFVMGLIVEDEDRHHRLMDAMARDLKSSVQWLHKDELPVIAPDPKAKANILAETERFLGVELESARQLKELKKEVKQLRNGLLEVIVSGMEADTLKHIEMLKHVRKQLKGEGRP